MIRQFIVGRIASKYESVSMRRYVSLRAMSARATRTAVKTLSTYPIVTAHTKHPPKTRARERDLANIVPECTNTIHNLSAMRCVAMFCARVI